MRQRPIAVTVFGILNIGYALLKYMGLLFALFLMQHKMPGNTALDNMRSDPLYKTMTRINSDLTAVFGLILITSGVGLLLMKNWARVLSIVYGVLEIIAVLGGAVLTHRVMMQTITSTQVPGAPPGLIAAVAQFSFAMGILIGLAYPILLIVFMTRPKITEAFLQTDPAAPH